MKKIYILSLLIALALFCCACSSDQPYSDGTSIPSDDEEVYFEDGYVSYLDRDIFVEHAESTACTPEALAAWYSQDILDQDYEVGIIIYSDREGLGVHAANGIITTNVVIQDDAFVEKTSKTVIYKYQDGQLVE